MNIQRDTARSLFQVGVIAADPAEAISGHLAGMDRPALIIAIGKAAMPMARAALEAFPGVPTRVVTNYENAGDLPGATVMAAGHPVPDENGAAGAAAVLADLAAAKGPVLALVSGGASALVPAPVQGVTLDDKIALNELLLSTGYDITQMNLIRQQVSRLKGGGMVRAAAPHPVAALIMSDVVGGDVSVIASGPTAAPLGTAAEARAILRGVWDKVPASIQKHLENDLISPPMPPVSNTVVGSNELSVAAMADVAPEAVVLPPVEGDVADAARFICDHAGPGVTLWGGETTVIIRGTGRGGRNQELALRIATEARARGWGPFVCLQGGTDGRDGPTDAAGGIVDHGTLSRIGDVEGLLANNDSYAALAEAGDLLMMGATGTNVADLGVLIRG